MAANRAALIDRAGILSERPVVIVDGGVLVPQARQLAALGSNIGDPDPGQGEQLPLNSQAPVLYNGEHPNVVQNDGGQRIGERAVRPLLVHREQVQMLVAPKFGVFRETPL